MDLQAAYTQARSALDRATASGDPEALALASRLVDMVETMSQQTQPAPPREPQILGGRLAGQAQNMLNAATFEFGDELGAAGAVPFTYLDPDYAGLSIPERYRKAKENINAPRERFVEDNPMSGLVGQLAGAVATGKPYVPKVNPSGLMDQGLDLAQSVLRAPASVPKGFGAVVPLAKTGATQGAVMGAGQSESLGDMGMDALQSGVVGGAAGGAIPAGLQLGSTFLRGPVSPYVTDLMRRGVTPTPGQVIGGGAKEFEEQLASRPILGSFIRQSFRRGHNEFNKAMLDDVLEPIGQRAAGVGHEGIVDAHSKISKNFDNLLPKLNVQIDDQAVGQLRNLDELTTGMSPEAKTRLDEIVQRVVSRRFEESGRMHPVNYKEMESELTSIASDFKSSLGNFDERRIGHALDEVNRIMREMLERTNPKYARELRNTNKAYAKLIRAERGAAGVGAKEGVMTPAQFGRAVAGADRSARKRNVAHGKALMQPLARAGEEVLSQRVPDSGTAGRLLVNAGLAGGTAGGAAALSTIDPSLALPMLAGMAYLPGSQRVISSALAHRSPGVMMAGKSLGKLASPGLVRPNVELWEDRFRGDE